MNLRLTFFRICIDNKLYNNNLFNKLFSQLKYIMVSVMVKAVDKVLLGSFQYKLSEGAGYVDRRESCTFFPQGSDVYSPSSVKKGSTYSP